MAARAEQGGRGAGNEFVGLTAENFCILRPVELRHLRYFVTVADLTNFTRAARRLRVAQPALSRQIQDLEEELGLTLFERGPRGTRLTPAGRAFLPEAQGVLQRAEQARQTARAWAEGARGEVHVGYAPSPTIELLPQALQALKKEAPGVRAVLHDLTSEEMLRGLRDGQIELALMVCPHPDERRGIVFEELRHYPVCVAMHARHRL